MNKNLIAAIAAVLGVVLILLAFVYWLTPANALPQFLPGYSATATAAHVKHGVAALVIGLLLIAFAWFASGKKSKN